MEDVEYTCFRYIRWLDIYNSEKPFQVLIDLPADAKDRRRSNIEFRDGARESVRNARSDLSTFDIDKHGFTFVKHKTALQQPEFLSKESIERVYLPECKELLQASLEGVDRVHIFNWLVRLNVNPSDTLFLSLTSSIDQRYRHDHGGWQGKRSQ